MVLAGGGIPGWMYEIGCLTALDDFLETKTSREFDIFVGTSAGAAVASLLANGVRPRVIFEDILHDRPTVFNFQRKNIYSFGYQETFHLLRRFVRSFFPILRHFFRNRDKMSFLDLLYLFQENLPSGVFTLKNFDLYLQKAFSTGGMSNAFSGLTKELYIPAVNVDSGRYDVFGEEGFRDVPISTAVVASSAIPILFQPIRINGADYIDGGVGRVAYMDIALHHGADLVLVLNPVQYIFNDRNRVCIPSFSDDCAGLKEKGMSFIFDQAMRINTNTRLYMAMCRYRAEWPGKDFLLFQPDPTESTMFLQNVIGFKARIEVLRYGYNSTARRLREGFNDFRACFEKHGIRVSLDRLKELPALP